MTKKKSITTGLIIIAILAVIMLVLNVVLNTYGDTLATYVGGGSVSADEGGDSMTMDETITEGREISMELESEGAVLLRNENDALPLEKGSKVTLLGAQSYNYVFGGTGSAGGAIDEYSYTMKEAFEGNHTDSSGATASTEEYLDVNDKAWEWLEEAVGGYRNADTSGEYVGHTGTGEETTFSGSEYPGADGTNTNKDNYGSGDWGGYERVCEFSVEVYENHYDEDIAEDGYNDTVIVTFARSGAEGASPVMDYDGDGVVSTGTTYLQLSEDEEDLLKFCNEHYDTTIVLINSSAAVEIGEIEQEEYGVDACLWIGHPGESGLVGVAQVLTGEVSPSGRLADTYAYDMSTMPSFYNNDDNKYANLSDSTTPFGDSNSSWGYYQYEEGIYIGYRYYETADAEGYFDSSEFTSHEWKNGTASGYDEVVQYPFGYGLSYTTFTQEIVDTDISLTAHGSGSIDVKVTNTGAVAGKDVVQIYVESPYGVDSNLGISGTYLQKSAKVLIGFAKTSTLAAGESETVTVSFDVDDFASFDTYGYGCYVMEKGDYVFHVGQNAHEDYDKTDEITLSSTIIYNDDSGNAGARSSDENVAEVAMADVDAGDGNMLEGYLNRDAFASGMATIMTHESNCTTENLGENQKAALETGALSTTNYSYTTYENGEKVTKTVAKYVNGTSYLAYSEEANWEGLYNNSDRYLYDDENEDHLIEYGKTYYVVVDDDGEAVLDDDGNYQVTEEETSMRLDVNAEILEDADYENEIWAYLLDQTTLDEQVTVQGGLGWNTPAVSSVNKTQVTVVDGPGEAGNGNASYTGNTWFPSAVVNASTWNGYLLERLGHVYAHQSYRSGLGGAYAPAMNTHRSPFGGRNFEYYSEDGFLGGMMGAAEVTGLQAEGIVVFIKHMAMNDSDTNRDGNLTWFSEQAAREIMLKDYEISVHKVFVSNSETENGEWVDGEGALGIMASLNRDGLSMFHQGLYKNILRGEWGFNGLIITDGVGPMANVMSPVAGLYGGVEGQLGGSTITGSTFVAIEGDATSNNYGTYLLRQCTKHMLYQACKSAQIEASVSETYKVIWTVANVVLGVGMVAVAVVFFVVPFIKKDKKQ